MIASTTSYAETNNYRYILLGDFNYPHIKWGCDDGSPASDYSYFQLTCDRYHLSQVISFSTHKDCNILDIVLVPDSQSGDYSFSKNPDFNCNFSYSDHSAININLNMNKIAGLYLPYHVASSLPQSNLNNLFQEQILNISSDLKSVEKTLINFNFGDVNSILQFIYSSITKILTDRCPRTTILTQHRMMLPPWVSKDSSHLIHIKQTMIAKRLRNCSINDHKIKELEKRLLDSLHVDCNNYLTTITNPNRATQRRNTTMNLYKFINKLHSIDIGTNFCRDTHNENSVQATADCFNSYFNSVYNYKHCPDAINFLMASTIKNVNSAAYGLSKFNIDKHLINTAINKSKASHRFAPGGFPVTFIKQFQPEMTNILYILFKFIVDSAIYPDCWKSARILPLPKIANAKDLCHYRPIALLDPISNVFERIIFDQLNTFLDDSFTPSQFGFRPKKSINLQMADYMDVIYKNIDSKANSVICYMDIKKAFDTVHMMS